MKKVNFLTFKSENPNGIYLVTGEIGAGKSVFCGEMAASAIEAGMRCGGVLSPGVFEDGEKTQIMMHDVSSGDEKIFAEKMTLKGNVCADLRIGQWCMSTDVLHWGNTVLQNLDEDLDVVFLDELGPLEFWREMGLMVGLDILEEKKFDLIFVVIRPSLVDEARERFDVDGIIEL